MAQAVHEHRTLDVALPLHLSEPEGDDVRATADLGHCLVTGAAGYLGRHLAAELLRRGLCVRGFDLAPAALQHPHYEHVEGDITAREAVRKACAGIDTIFHTAAVLDFARFSRAAQRERSHAVNVRGVEGLVRAAREAGVARFVHTSSDGVTADGPVIDGDESRPYAARTRDLDTETKILGEQVALAANGYGGVLSCAIRPGRIYGPGESRVFPRVIEACAGGRFVVKLGDGRARFDPVFIENLVDGEIEAARHLLPGSPVCGEAYFVSDGRPVGPYDFVGPVVEALGFRQPARSLPAGPLYALAAAWELLHLALGSLGLPRPPLLAHEVRRIAVSRHNRIDKARRDFGWRPLVSPEAASARMLEPCRRLLAGRERIERPHWGWWVTILGGLGALALLALSSSAHAAWASWPGPSAPQPWLRLVLAWALGLHVWKALRAVQLAERLGLRRTALAWGWQTFALGFPSLRLLERRARAAGEPGSLRS